MVVGNHQCNAANLNQSKAEFQLELSLAQFSPSLFSSYSSINLYNTLYYTANLMLLLTTLDEKNYLVN